MNPPYRLSCHCGAIKLEVEAELDGLRQCNCSTCRRFGAIHWYVDTKLVHLVDEKRSMTNYVWQEIHEGHCFCSTCGTSIMRTGYPNGVVSLNACCIEEIDIFELDVTQYAGRSEMPPGVLP